MYSADMLHYEDVYISISFIPCSTIAFPCGFLGAPSLHLNLTSKDCCQELNTGSAKHHL